MLFVVNLFSSPVDANIKIELDEKIIDMDVMHLKTMEVICREVD